MNPGKKIQNAGPSPSAFRGKKSRAQRCIICICFHGPKNYFVALLEYQQIVIIGRVDIFWVLNDLLNLETWKYVLKLENLRLFSFTNTSRNDRLENSYLSIQAFTFSCSPLFSVFSNVDVMFSSFDN